MPRRSYIVRLVDGLLTELLEGLPAVLIVGPRATGKTTTARRHARSFIRLDRPAEAAAVAADPDVGLRDLPEPILIDEWQLVPDVLGAIMSSCPPTRRRRPTTPRSCRVSTPY